MTQPAGFAKKGYTFGEFLRAFFALGPMGRPLLRLYMGPAKLEPVIRERIMLSVALKNDCRH